MYSVHDYGRMAADAVRMDAYARAIARAVKPGDTVLDIGAGTGVMSILAARAGAKRVHAIDPNPAVWLVADLARENGVADRIIVHHASSLEIELDGRADVAVSDLRGTTPLNGDHLPALRDARRRLLRPGATMIPARDRLFVAVVEAEGMWRWLARAWESFEHRGVSANAARSSIVNTAYSDVVSPVGGGDVLSEVFRWATLDYATHEGDVIEGTQRVAIRRGGVAHGLAVWFETDILDDIGYTTAPGHSLAYSRSFLPFFEPVRVEAGAPAEVTVRADVRGNRWAWEAELASAGGTKRFRHSTFFGMPTSPEALLREATTYKPALSPRGTRMLRLLEAMNGERSVADLVAHVSAGLPDASPVRGLVSDEVRNAVSRYGR